MTRQRDLKRRVRDRQARTGESYTAALLHVRAQRPLAAEQAMPPSEPIHVVELIDVTELGAALGIKCRIRIAPDLAERVDTAGVLRQLCSTLAATARDPQLAPMRDVVLHGEPPVGGQVHAIQDGIRFVQRVRAGIGGVSNSGHMLAFAVTGRSGAELVVFGLWVSMAPYHVVPPTLIVSSASLFGDGLRGLDALALDAIRRLP